MLAALLALLTAAPPEAAQPPAQVVALDLGVLIPASPALTVGPSLSVEGQVVFSRWVRLGLSVGGAFLPSVPDGLQYAPGDHGVFRFMVGPEVGVAGSWGSLGLSLQVGGGFSNWVVDTYDPYCCGKRRTKGFDFDGVLAARVRVGFELTVWRPLVLGLSLATLGTLRVATWDVDPNLFFEPQARIGIRL